jgi:hypothetical protein
MRILMAGKAALVEPEEGSFQIDCRIEFSRISRDFVRFMTITAPGVPMLTQQQEAGKAMVEFCLAIRPVNHVEIPSVVIAVTFKTWLFLTDNDEEMITGFLR